MGIENIDFALYLNISFFSVLAIGLLFGLLKGFRRSLYTFIITVIFIGIFFLTVNPIVTYLYNLELNFIGGLASNVSGGLSQATSVQEAARLFLFEQFGENLDTSQTNPEFLAFADAMGMFVLKIVYTILYFSIIQVIYRLILFIASLFIFRKGRSKNKKGKRGRALGGVFGTLTAAVNVFVMIIMLSGIISISESLVSLQGEPLAYQIDLDRNTKPNITRIDQSLTKIGKLNPQQMAETNTALDDAMASLETIITEYNNNIIIQGVNAFQVEDEVTGENKNLAIILFDEVLSINYENESIALRQDLRTFTEIAGIYLNSDFYNSNDLADLKSQEVNDMFLKLSQSKLITTIIPIGIEVGMDYMDVDFELEKELLYEDINWQEELAQLGVVASTGFMILENADAFDPDTDYKTISLDGQEVDDLFTELSNSKLVEYGAYIAIEPLLEGATQTVQSVITVPEDIDWKDEFQAFGMIANEILSTGLTVADLEGENQQDLLLLFTEVDLTVLLNSQLTSNALINIFSGEAEIGFNIEFLVIPNADDIQWNDTINELTGEVALAGELRNILTSLNILVQQLDNIDIDNLQIQDLSGITDDEIDQMFESVILVASISQLITDLDTGDFNLVIPDRVLDENQYIIKEEVTNIFKALTMASREIPCDEGNTACADIGFDMDKVTQLSTANVDTLFSSDILYATTASMLTEFEELIIPEDIKEDLLVDSQIVSLPSKEEIKKTFSAITALGITDFQNISMSGDLLLNLSVDSETDPTTLDTTKTDKIFASAILHATISYFILQEIDVTPPETSPLIIPYFAAENYEGTTSNIVRYYDTAGEVDYISSEELTNIIAAILVLDITDFSTFDTIDINTIISNSEVILDSAILHATFSDQIMNLNGSGLVIPSKDELDNDIVIISGDILEEQTTYIIKSELIATLDSLEVLEITDFNNPTIDVSVLNKLAKDSAPTELDEDKTALLFSSKILHATITDFILQEADGTATASLVLPYYASENYESTTSNVVRITNSLDEEYISINELNALIAAFLVLDITDFTEVEALDFTKITSNSTLILKSAILHATISKQMLDLNTSESLVIPSLDDLNQPLRVTTGILPEEQTEYIIKDEITATLDALDILGITDFNNVNIDASVLTNLADDTDSTLLDTNKSDTLLSSKIAHATLSKVILDAAAPDEITGETDIIVPFVATENYATGNGNVRFVTTDDDIYIIKEELTNLFRAILILDITDFTQVSGLQLSTIATHKDIVLDSAILHATISDQVIELGNSENLVLPELDLNNDPILVTKGDVLIEETDYIIKDELKNTLDALDILDITDFNNVTINASILQKLADDTDSTLLDPTKSATLLSSKIAHATISKVILDAAEADPITGDTNLVVPYYATGNYTGTSSDVVRFTTTALDYYITELELTELFEAILVLDIDDFNQVEGLLLSDIIDNSTTLLESAVLHATISKQVIELNEMSSDILIPETNELGNSIILEDTLGEGAEFITKVELEATFSAMDLLGMTDIDSFDGNISLSLFFKSSYPIEYADNQDTLLASSIMQATISDKLANLETSNMLIIPGVDDLNQPIEATYGTDYFVLKTEIKSLINVLDILGVSDIETFDGAINLGLFFESTNPTTYQDNQDTLLASSSMQATISDKLADLELGGQLIIPAVNVLSQAVEVTHNTDYFIYDDDIKALINVMDLFGVTDIDSFDGGIDLGLFFESTNPTTYQNNQDLLMDSSIMHVTLSSKLSNLETSGELIIPSVDVLNQAVEVTNGADYYVYASEIKSLINAMDVFGVTDIDTFNGEISISNFSSETNQDILLASAIMHMTVSDQILSNTTTTVPEKSLESNLTNIDIRIIQSGNEFILGDEIKALINVMNLISTGNIDQFSGEITLSLFDGDTNPANQATLLSSAIMHATVSKQVLDLDTANTLVAPEEDIDSAIIRKIVIGTYINTEYLVKSEIAALIDGLNAMGLGSQSISSFAGTIGISALSTETVQNEVLASATLHATISKQVIDLDTSNTLVAPNKTLDALDNEIFIRLTTGSTFTTEFLIKDEVKALIDGLNILGLGGQNISDFDGNLSISTLDTNQKQTDVLASAVLHATFSDNLIVMDDQILFVPSYSELGEIQAYRIKYIVDTTDFMIKDEIKAIINAFTAMGYLSLDDVDSSFTLDTFFDNPNIVLASSSIQATVSNKLLNDTGGSLIIPDDDINENPDKVIRIVQTDVTYIELVELKALIAGLESLGLTNFTGMTFTPANIFAADFNIVLTSASLQATISDTILAGAVDENNITSSSDLIIPTYFRETITVDSVSATHIEKTELNNLLTGLEELGVTSFSGGVDPTIVTGLSSTQLNTILNSGSLHVTIDNMLQANATLTIPTFVLVDLYNIVGLIEKTEIVNFIASINALGETDVTNASFDFATIAGLTPTEQNIVLESAIVRATITPDVETAKTTGDMLNPLNPYTGTWAYETDGTTLTKPSIQGFINHVY
ncbi:MAG: hypothetical protein PF513_07355 [Tenericutes bacterium]|jgi:hypothetical protein|nr:hypothetical protein [Mycoplasmatota bacterium]